MSETPNPPAPAPVRWAAAGVVVQGLVALVAAVVLAVAGALSFSVWGFLVLVGAVVAGVGVALLRGVRGARGPALVTQLVLLGIAYYATVPSRQPAWGVPTAVLAAAVIAGLLSRAGRDWAGG